MRYIGSKKRLLGFLEKTIVQNTGNVEGKRFCDLFAGTVSISKKFKKLNAEITSNDYMAFSYVFQLANLKFNSPPAFLGLTKEKLDGYYEILNFLNSLGGKKGFFYREYTLEGSSNSKYQRNYFSAENAKKIDHILSILSKWKQEGYTTFEEDCFIRASLIEGVTKISNISGTYGSFLKKDDRRKFKRLKLEPIRVPKGRIGCHKCLNEDAFDIIEQVEGDILYMDPPYNNRQYPPYYHILETLALDDNPDIYGKTGRRPYENMKSPLCFSDKASNALEELVSKARFEHLFISYNTDGIIPVAELNDILKRYGNVKKVDKSYRRFKSNSNGSSKKRLKELLFYVQK